MAKYMQIIDVGTSGEETVLHPETTADYVEAGRTYKVPKITEINNWEDKSSEVEAARKGLPNLKGKIDTIDTALLAGNLLNKIKEVDGSGCGLDADKIDGRDVNDSDSSSSSLWTANKISTELGKKVDASSVVSEAQPNKILKLNSDKLLPASINGNASTASTFRIPETISFSGGVLGKMTIKGGQTQDVNIKVVNNGHEHNKLFSKDPLSVVKDLDPLGRADENILDFINKGTGGGLVSSIDYQGNFTGSANAVNGKSVSDGNPRGLWTGRAIQGAINEAVGELYQYDRSKSEVRIGGMVIKFGEVSISEESSVTLYPVTPSLFEKIIGESYVLVSSDNTLTYVKDASSSSATVKLNFNKTAPSGAKLRWFVVTI